AVHPHADDVQPLGQVGDGDLEIPLGVELGRVDADDVAAQEAGVVRVDLDEGHGADAAGVADPADDGRVGGDRDVVQPADRHRLAGVAHPQVGQRRRGVVGEGRLEVDVVHADDQ